MTRLTLSAGIWALVRRERLCAAHPELRVWREPGTGKRKSAEPAVRPSSPGTRFGELLNRVEVVLARHEPRACRLGSVPLVTGEARVTGAVRGSPGLMPGEDSTQGGNDARVQWAALVLEQLLRQHRQGVVQPLRVHQTATILYAWTRELGLEKSINGYT
jgi:hypothetical protein